MKEYSVVFIRTLESEYFIEAESVEEAEDMWNNGNWDSNEHITEGHTFSYNESETEPKEIKGEQNDTSN